MIEQAEFFLPGTTGTIPDPIRDVPNYRNTDPATSKMAGLAMTGSKKLNGDKRVVLWAVGKYPGHTSKELAGWAGEKNEMVHKRLPELLRAGMVRKGNERTCTISGSKAATWYIEGGM